MTRAIHPIISLPIFLTLAVFCQGEEIDFAHQIVPLLKQKCAECHSGDKKKGGFSFNTREALLEGGENGKVVEISQADKSKMIELVTTADKDDRMPPKGDALTDAEVALLKQWINEGLKWEEGYAFKKPSYEPALRPRKPVLPPATNERTHPIDRIIDSYLTAGKLPVPPPIDDATFYRRVSMDLVGLLPPPEKLQLFLKDASPGKRTKLIQELLADDLGYAEHWLTFWNDLLRNDYDGTGFITGGRTQISKWLHAALMSNMPYDQMTRELVAPPTPESNGFINGIRWRGEVSAGQTVEIQFAQSISQSLLGINMKCASCHDSFIDRWKLDEAYGLAAIYAQSPLEIHRCDKPVGRQAAASWIFPELGQIDAKAPQPERLKQLAALMTHPENGRFARTIVNRLWKQMMGRGIVHPVDAMQTEPWSEDLLDYLATHLVESKYDLKMTLGHIATSAAYQSQCQHLDKDTDNKPYVYAGPRARRLTAEQFLDAVWTITGTAPGKFDAPVIRSKPAPAGAAPNKSQAQWIWGDSAKNGAVPPSGEVIALTRTFQLSAKLRSATAAITCDNEYVLYINGVKAGEDKAWESVETFSILQNLVPGENRITVMAKNAGSGPNAAGLLMEIRLAPETGDPVSIASDDAWKFAAGTLAVKKGRLEDEAKADWKPVTVVPELPAWNATASSQFPQMLAQTEAAGALLVRAALLKSSPLMRSLGRPNRDQIVTMRPTDLTTLEAMDLANGKALADIIAAGAEKLVARNFTSAEEFIRWLYEQALSREPAPAEMSTAKDVLGAPLTARSVEDLIWAIIVQPEFLLVR